ncbi:MAG: hypothetical protein H0T08_06745 [Acidobacteria bacterium]|jgi:hypothetical protein|nr:hypothetical protein [Acidobacteriota bacterium]
MVNQTSRNIVGEFNKLNEIESRDVITYISKMISARTTQQKEPSPNDDLILSLSNAYENKRARQVIEWEKVRRQNSQRTA